MTFAVVVMQNSKGITHHIGDHHRNHWVKFDIMNSKDCRGNQRRTISSVFAVAVYMGFKGNERSMEWRREREMTKYLVNSVVVNVNAALAVGSFLRMSLFLTSSSFHLSFSSPFHRASVSSEPDINYHCKY